MDGIADLTVKESDSAIIQVAKFVTANILELTDHVKCHSESIEKQGKKINNKRITKRDVIVSLATAFSITLMFVFFSIGYVEKLRSIHQTMLIEQVRIEERIHKLTDQEQRIKELETAIFRKIH